MEKLLFFLDDVGVVVAGKDAQPPPVQLDDPVHRAVEKGPVVGDDDDGRRQPSQILLQPEKRGQVQMVGRFI